MQALQPPTLQARRASGDSGYVSETTQDDAPQWDHGDDAMQQHHPARHGSGARSSAAAAAAAAAALHDSSNSRRRTLFTPEEDEVLRSLVQEHGESSGVDGWIKIADGLNRFSGSSLGVERTWKSCHQRWFKYLQSGLRSVRVAPLSYEERKLIEQLYEQIGRNPRTGKVQWKRINEEFSKVFNGRTTMDMKNYMNTVFNRARNSNSAQPKVVETVAERHAKRQRVSDGGPTPMQQQPRPPQQACDVQEAAGGHLPQQQQQPLREALRDSTHRSNVPWGAAQQAGGGWKPAAQVDVPGGPARVSAASLRTADEVDENAQPPTAGGGRQQYYPLHLEGGMRQHLHKQRDGDVDTRRGRIHMQQQQRDASAICHVAHDAQHYEEGTHAAAAARDGVTLQQQQRLRQSSAQAMLQGSFAAQVQELLTGGGSGGGGPAVTAAASSAAAGGGLNFLSALSSLATAQGAAPGLPDLQQLLGVAAAPPPPPGAPAAQDPEALVRAQQQFWSMVVMATMNQAMAAAKGGPSA